MPDVRFTDLDFDEAGATRGYSVSVSVLFGVCLLAISALFAYDYAFGFESVRFRQFDWPLPVAVTGVVVYGVVPLARNPTVARNGAARLVADRRTLAALAVLGVVFAVGLFGPFVLHEPRVDIFYANQPPLGLSAAIELVNRCLGAVVDGRCLGTTKYPLGTAFGGFDVLNWTVYGMRVVVAVGLVSGLVVAAVGTLVGTLTGYLGGRFDELVMRYVDLQQVVPAFLVYIVLRLVLEGSLFALVFVFGLLNWGGTARLVRSETRSIRESGYVTASRAAGASSFTVVRQHVVPNVAGAALTSAANRASTLILAEASLAFLDLGPPQVHSLGRLAAIGLTSLDAYPWVATIPVFVLFVTAISLGVAGEGVRRAFDPRA